MDTAMNLSILNNISILDPNEIPDLRYIPYPMPIKSPPLTEIMIKSIFTGIIIVLSLVGNTLVVATVFSNKSMRTTTNYFIVNLAVSDLMVTCSCTWVHLVDDLTEGWVLGAFFCKFNSFAQVLSLVSSILTLTLISCDRFFGIVFAMKAHVTERKSHVFILLIWVCAIGISSPLLIYRQQFIRQWLNHTEVWCADTWPVTTPSHKAIYFTFISLVLYFFPIVVMTVAYSMIIWKLWSANTPGEYVDTAAQNHVKKKVVIMLVIIMSVFALCWLPFQIAILYSEYRPDQMQSLPPWFSKFYFFANYMAFANSAFNPIIYTGFNENFRKGFKTALLYGCGKEVVRKNNYISVSRSATNRTTRVKDTSKYTCTTLSTHTNGSSDKHLSSDKSREQLLR